MYLAEAEGLEVFGRVHPALHAATEAWENFPPSELSDHRQPCCCIAREWLHAMDASHTPASDPLSGPRWIRQRVTWGPSLWPLYWCQAVKAKTLDCGALAVLAKEVFCARGLKCHTAQFIQQYTKNDSSHWYRSWERAQAEVHWIQEDLAYHEAVAVVLEREEIRIWDPTAGWWVDPKQVTGYSGVLAARIVTQNEAPRHFTWASHRIAPNLWQPLHHDSAKDIAQMHRHDGE
jgi:hypothetical protein